MSRIIHRKQIFLYHSIQEDNPLHFTESETVELKSIVVDDIKKEIIAFANCEGGKLYIGVNDEGDVIGVDNPDQIMLQISNMVRDTIKPDVTMFLHYNTIEIDEKQIVLVDIQRGTNRPYYLAKKGLRPEGVYVRQGTSSVPSTDTAIRPKDTRKAISSWSVRFWRERADRAGSDASRRAMRPHPSRRTPIRVPGTTRA